MWKYVLLQSETAFMAFRYRRLASVDRSKDVVGAAARWFADAVRAAQAEFRLGTVENLAEPDAAFDKALSVHTIYFR